MAQQIKKSEIVWTSLLASCLIVTGLFSLEILGGFLGIGSLFVIVHVMDHKDDDDTKYTPYLWCFLFPVTYLVFILGAIILIAEKLYKICIEPINRKLNGE